MRAESTGIAKIAQQPSDRQHANQCDQTDDADWNIAFRDRQRVGFTRFTRARRSHRACQAADKGLCKLQQSPNCRNANRAGTNVSDFAAPCAASERGQWSCEIMGKRRVVRYSPTPTDKRANKHCYPNRETDKVPDPEQQKRQREIVAADSTLPPNSKVL